MEVECSEAFSGEGVQGNLVPCCRVVYDLSGDGVVGGPSRIIMSAAWRCLPFPVRDWSGWGWRRVEEEEALMMVSGMDGIRPALIAFVKASMAAVQAWTALFCTARRCSSASMHLSSASCALLSRSSLAGVIVGSGCSGEGRGGTRVFGGEGFGGEGFAGKGFDGMREPLVFIPPPVMVERGF